MRQLQDLVRRKGCDLDLFVWIPFELVCPHRLFNEHKMAAIRLHRRIWMHDAQQLCRRAGIARLFPQLTQSSNHRILTRIDHPARYFEGEFIDAIAELPYEHEVP